MTLEEIQTIRNAAMEEWDTWCDRLTNLPIGTHEITVAEEGPTELFSLHGNDKRKFIVTDEGWVLLVHEGMFEEFISRYNIAKGMKLRIEVCAPEVPNILKSCTVI